MKRLLVVLIAALMVLSLAACGKGNDSGDNGGNSGGNTSGQEGKEDKGTENKESGSKDQGGETAAVMTPGTLNDVNLKDGEEPVLKGLRLVGNRAGSGIDTEGGINNKPASKEGIRCIFELNEWVEVYPDIDKKAGLTVYIRTHQEDQGAYEKMSGSALGDGAAAVCAWTDEGGEDPASFYLNPDDCGSGYYDFVFTSQDQVIATMLAYFYNQDELEGKSDAELEKLMKGLEAQKIK